MFSQQNRDDVLGWAEPGAGTHNTQQQMLRNLKIKRDRNFANLCNYFRKHEKLTAAYIVSDLQKKR